MGTMPGRLVNAQEAKDAVVVWRCRSMAGNSMGDTNKILPFQYGASICECAVCFFTYTQALIWLGVVENVCSSVSKAKGSGRDAENKMNGLLVIQSDEKSFGHDACNDAGLWGEERARTEQIKKNAMCMRG